LHLLKRVNKFLLIVLSNQHLLLLDIIDLVLFSTFFSSTFLSYCIFFHFVDKSFKSGWLSFLLCNCHFSFSIFSSSISFRFWQNSMSSFINFSANKITRSRWNSTLISILLLLVFLEINSFLFSYSFSRKFSKFILFFQWFFLLINTLRIFGLFRFKDIICNFICAQSCYLSLTLCAPNTSITFACFNISNRPFWCCLWL
jgi:hypothetical protein